MNRIKLSRSLIVSTLAVTALLPVAAQAHPGHDITSNLAAGLLHPLTGLDHVLMIVALSAWAALLKPAGRVIAPLCLGLFVAVGALLPSFAIPGTALETAILLTVIVAGLLLAVGRKLPLWTAGVLASLFAVIHGFAHGAEGPAHSDSYVAGLVLATTGLSVVAVYVVTCLRSHNSDRSTVS
jgi:urease accessory protein